MREFAAAKVCWSVVFATLAVLPLLGSNAIAAGASASEAHFANSCDPTLADRISDAVTELHSFEYPEAERKFRQLLQVEPDCAVARWGVAMSLWHPLWAPPSDQEKRAARAVLGDLDHLRATPREHLYLQAIAAYFVDDANASEAARRQIYSEQMNAIYQGYRDDAEAAVFYALSLLATADPKDKSYALQYKAAGILNWVRESQPQHPGVLHYLIHSYDYPELAHLALGSAMIYAEAAPDSAHAQHMPSHIFTRLGLWERSLSSNHDSTASAAAYTERAGLPGHYDEGLHSIDYLMYAMLQTARDEEAAALLETLRGIKKTHPDTFKVAYTYAASPARYLLERRDWQAASTLPLGFDEFRWNDFPWAVSINHFARGIGAARSGNIAAAKKELAAVQKIKSDIAPTTQPYLREEVSVHEEMIAAWIAVANGNSADAIRLASAAADREDTVDKHPVTPGEVLPARELYADLLMEAGEPAEALQNYRVVLKGSPNRFNALLGAAQSALAVGDRDTALRYYAEVVAVAPEGSSSRTGLAEARDMLGQVAVRRP